MAREDAGLGRRRPRWTGSPRGPPSPRGPSSCRRRAWPCRPRPRWRAGHGVGRGPAPHEYGADSTAMPAFFGVALERPEGRQVPDLRRGRKVRRGGRPATRRQPALRRTATGQPDARTGEDGGEAPSRSYTSRCFRMTCAYRPHSYLQGVYGIETRGLPGRIPAEEDARPPPRSPRRPSTMPLGRLMAGYGEEGGEGPGDPEGEEDARCLHPGGRG